MDSFLNDRPILYLITSGEARDENFFEVATKIVDLVSAAKEAGVNAVQIREKNLSARLLFELARTTSAITKDSYTKLFINDRADIAAASGADGVHLRADSVAANYVREYFGAEFLIGVSTHTKEEVSAAKKNGADFVVFGPVFESHSDAAPKGIDSLAAVVGAAGDFPVIALGGINESNFGECFRVGAAGISGIRLFGDPQDLRRVVSKIRSEFE